MGLEFLNRVRRASLIAGAVLSVVAATYRGPWEGLALAAGTIWSLLNLLAIERLVVALTGRERGTAPALRRAGWTISGMALLFAAGGLLLVKLPIPGLSAGFLLPFAVIALKAGSTLLIQSRLWRRVVASPWQAALLVATVLVAAWWVVPAVLQHPAEAETEAVVVQHDASTNATAAETATPATEGEHAMAEGGEHAAAAGEHGEAGDEHGESKEPQKFASFLTVIVRAFPHAAWAHTIHQFESVIFGLIVAILISIVAFFASRNASMIPHGLQNGVEIAVEALYDFIAGIIGEKYAPRFVPFLGTLGLYIWVMNLFGLIPFMESPTSNLNVTFALGLVVFVYAQWIGIRDLGVVGYVDHLMGQPRDLTGWILAPLMLPIHVLGELAKPISLSCRLFGNVFGEDMLLVAFVSLGITSLSFLHLPIGLPLHVPFLFLALLTGTIQAAVFMVLATIYFLLMLPHEEHGHEAQHAHSH